MQNPQVVEIITFIGTELGTLKVTEYFKDITTMYFTKRNNISCIF